MVSYCQDTSWHEWKSHSGVLAPPLIGHLGGGFKEAPAELEWMQIFTPNSVHTFTCRKLLHVYHANSRYDLFMLHRCETALTKMPLTILAKWSTKLQSEQISQCSNVHLYTGGWLNIYPKQQVLNCLLNFKIGCFICGSFANNQRKENNMIKSMWTHEPGLIADT